MRGQESFIQSCHCLYSSSALSCLAPPLLEYKQWHEFRMDPGHLAFGNVGALQ
jgi:hypothetical protein